MRIDKDNILSVLSEENTYTSPRESYSPFASNIGLMVTDTRLYKAVALRLVIVPLACIPILMFMPVSYEIRMVLMIIAAAPAASATSMLALKYGGDYSYGTGLAIGTTIVSMITMPLVLALAMQIL